MTGGPLDDLLRSYGGADTLSGGAGADTLDGGSGDDVINGGAGHDVITTGAGADIVMVGLSASGTTAATADSIADWSSADKLIFASVPASGAEYAESTAADYSAASTYAGGLIASGAANVVAVQVGGDVVVFADSAANNGSADDVVMLTGKGLAGRQLRELHDDAGHAGPSAASASADTRSAGAAGRWWRRRRRWWWWRWRRWRRYARCGRRHRGWRQLRAERGPPTISTAPAAAT